MSEAVTTELQWGLLKRQESKGIKLIVDAQISTYSRRRGAQYCFCITGCELESDRVQKILARNLGHSV